MRFLATILYEDSRGPQKDFGLHKLVVRCVLDRVTARGVAVEDYFGFCKRFDDVPTGPARSSQ